MVWRNASLVGYLIILDERVLQASRRKRGICFYREGITTRRQCCMLHTDGQQAKMRCDRMRNRKSTDIAKRCLTSVSICLDEKSSLIIS